MAKTLRAIPISMLLICAGMLLIPSTALSKGGPLDMGDAPDGRSAGYAKSRSGVVGRFPSRLASAGPRHAGWRGLRLGLRADGESDSHQVDRDRYDDGAEARLRSCSAGSRLTLGLNGRGLTAAQRAKGNVIYVNAWFDWNRDGDWEDASPGCAGEWAIRNLAVPAASLGSDRLRLLPIAFKAGKQTRELWWRVTVTLNEPATDASGRGPTPYALGETEDYFQAGGGGEPIFEEEKEREKKKPKLGVSCNPFVAVIPHGGTAKVGFNIVAPGKGGPVYGAFASPRKGKGFGIKLIPSKNQRGLPAGKIRAIGFAFKSTDVDPPVRFQIFRVRFVFWRGKTVRKLNCAVLVIHEGKGKKRKHGHGKKPPKIPAVRCKGPCAKGAPPYPNPPITPTPSESNPPPENEPPPPVEGAAKYTQIEGQQVNFEAQFNSALDRFLLYFQGFQVLAGGAMSDGENFSCEVVDFKVAFDALSCVGSIKPEVQIVGGLMLNPAPPGSPSAELYGYSGTTQYGPFPVDPLGF